jgi:hypothetical protein
MTSHDDRNDEDLRRAFGAQRREEAAQAPELGRVLAGRAPDPSRRIARLPLMAALAATGAALIAALVVTRAVAPRHPTDPAPVGAALEWTAPTDFLLRTPGQDILDTIPHIGTGSLLDAMPAMAGRPPASKQRSAAP